jgi:predicted nucleic acid-binding protein
VNAGRIVVLDACVLIPMPLADTLLRLAAGPRLFAPKWSDRMMEEVSRVLQNDFGLSPEKTAYRESEIRRHFPEAWTEGYERLIPSMTNHPKDRHVLAAAVHARAATIVTYNTKDFPPPSLAAHGITAVGPSTFLKDLYAASPEEIRGVLAAQAAAIGEPLHYVLSRLRVNVPGFVAMLEETI